jgi:hypothetical protein
MPSPIRFAHTLLAALALAAAANAHRPSQVPGCAWTCAPYDAGNYPLDANTSGPVEDTLYCQYEDPTLAYNICRFSAVRYILVVLYRPSGPHATLGTLC